MTKIIAALLIVATLSACYPDGADTIEVFGTHKGCDILFVRNAVTQGFVPVCPGS